MIFEQKKTTKTKQKNKHGNKKKQQKKGKMNAREVRTEINDHGLIVKSELCGDDTT